MKKKLTIKEIQKEELEILKEFIHFLEDKNINYFMWGGTFLGAIRHKGFIPWDDDIDLCITRPEYNKLLEIIKKNNYKINDNLEFIGYELGNSNFPYLKLINKNIEVLEEEMEDKYLWIDIFPIDGVPENSKKFLMNCKKLHTLLYLKQREKNHQELPASNFLIKIIKKTMMFLLRPLKYEKVLKMYYNYCTKYDYDKCEYLNSNFIYIGRTDSYHKKYFTCFEYEFEDIMVKGFKEYDDVLKIYFGNDYMQLPPIEKRISHNIEAWKINDK